MAYSFSNTPLYVAEGDYVQFRFKAPPQWDFTQTVTIQLGDLVQYWLITTIPEDFTPDPYPFQRVENAELDTLYTYADGSRTGEQIVTVTGLTQTTQAPVSLGANVAGGTDVYAMRIDYNGDGTWDTDWIQGNGTEVVENGAKIQIRGKTQNFNNQNTRVTLVIGTANEVWTITTKAVPLNIPEPFPNFTDLVGQPTSITAYSNVIRIQGLIGPATISVDGDAEWAISPSNTTSLDVTGRYEVLDGATFSSSAGTVNNGDYLQLRIPTSSNPNTPNATNLSIGDGANLSIWTVTTGAEPSTTPNSWTFPDKLDVVEDVLIASDSRPLQGITGLGEVDGESVSVPVELVSTTSTEVKIKINNGSIGVFPATVKNGDRITLYARSATTFSTPVEVTIKVGKRQIPTWTVITSSGPDYDAIFNTPADKVNQVPNTYISSSPITVTSINRPITITASNGALISIDYDTPVPGPRVFDPTINTSFYLVLLSPDQLATPEFTNVVVGTEATNLPAVSFTWTVTTYAVAPPPAANLAVWYSRKTEKFDGYPIGTVLPILKENVIVGYGDLSGNLGSRYAGFIECDGRSLDASQYWALYRVIGTQYGGSVVEGTDSNGAPTYVGNFNVPDYRNRRLCGVGFVDSSRGNSAFLPVTTPGKGIFDVGAEGGYWYFDTVSTAGSDPLEQIEGVGTEGLNSQFFSLGTVRLEGLETIQDSVSFTITGSVSAQVGPLSEVSVRVPAHEHLYLSAVVEGDGGDPLVPLNNSPGTSPRALFGTSQNPDTQYKKSYNGGNVKDFLIGEWSSWLSGLGNFVEEMQRYDANWTSLDNWIAQNLGTAQTADNGGKISTTASYMVWWRSPESALTGALLQNTNPAGSFAQAACIDTEPSSFTIDSYTPVSGVTNTHSHMITEDLVGNPQTDFTGGNVSGPGVIGGGVGSGLGGASSSKQVTFTQNEIFMDMSEGDFKFTSSFKRPTPDVAMRPQRQVPIINPFHKTKYIIKAY